MDSWGDVRGKEKQKHIRVNLVKGVKVEVKQKL
jgi:hypothetical protein